MQVLLGQEAKVAFQILKQSPALRAFVRQVVHRKARTHCLHQTKLSPYIQAKKDIIIKPGFISNMPVSGAFKGKMEWIIEKLFIKCGESELIAVPHTIIQ